MPTNRHHNEPRNVAYSRENLCITKDDFQTKCFEEALGTKLEEVVTTLEGEEV